MLLRSAGIDKVLFGVCEDMIRLQGATKEPWEGGNQG
jgi:hypothetical protein